MLSKRLQPAATAADKGVELLLVVDVRLDQLLPLLPLHWLAKATIHLSQRDRKGIRRDIREEDGKSFGTKQQKKKTYLVS